MVTTNARIWNKNFQEYTEFIFGHKNYEGLFMERGKDGKLNWVVAGKSPKGILRRKWWDKKCKENRIPIKAGCYATIAFKIHPTKIHVCQICGRSLSIDYIYPNKRLLTKIATSFGKTYKEYDLSILDIVEELAINSDNITKFVNIFKLKNSNKDLTKKDLVSAIKEQHIQPKNKALLSPGVMSNSPDRFDGYHSDGNCCRKDSDKGRHKSNLSRYGQDRRAYLNWSDGDWKQADRLMSEFSRYGISADHIGPISLGFCHRPKFQPMTREENSTKNNRMSLADVKLLINDEKNGEIVISWHSKYIWDKLKVLVKSESDALKLSKLMRQNMHDILTIFSIIYKNKQKNYLKRFLHPEYSFFDYKFENFDPTTGKYSNVIKISKTGKNQKNNIHRYERISFDNLKEYSKVENRRVTHINERKYQTKIKALLDSISTKNYTDADKLMSSILNELAEEALIKWNLISD